MGLLAIAVLLTTLSAYSVSAPRLAAQGDFSGCAADYAESGERIRNTYNDTKTAAVYYWLGGKCAEAAGKRQQAMSYYQKSILS